MTINITTMAINTTTTTTTTTTTATSSDKENKNYLLFFFVFEFEGGIDASSFVEKAAAHVDLADVADVEADEVEGSVEDDVGKQLPQKRAAFHGVLLKHRKQFD
jgi:hypothetical protein